MHLTSTESKVGILGTFHAAFRELLKTEPIYIVYRAFKSMYSI